MIPKIIHQIWIGDKKCPMEWIETWKEKNKKLEHILWNEEKISLLNIKNKDKYDYFLSIKEYYSACDILRVEILNKYGGIYVDADSICINSIEDEYFMRKDFFAAYEYDRKGCKDRVSNGVIGTIPNHPIMNNYLEKIFKAKRIRPSWKTIGSVMLTKCIEENGIDNKIEILPICSFYPNNYNKKVAKIVGKIYAKQFWASTKKLYK